MDNIKPKILISKCLGFEACRYDGAIINVESINSLKDVIDFIPICPEIEIGLGVPRDPIRIIKMNNELRLVQPSTKRDLTDLMYGFSKNYLESLKRLDGIILKRKSPTCGIRNVKIFYSMDSDEIITRGAGIFANLAKQIFSFLPIEDEKGLDNLIRKEHFLVRIFSFARFREIKKKYSKKMLIEYHSKMKYLLMAYNQKELKKLGKIVSSFDKENIKAVFKKYEKHLIKALKKPAKYSSHVNVLSHMMGYFKGEIGKGEKDFFYNLIQKYRDNKILLIELIKILYKWSHDFNKEYLKRQYYFNPYPGYLTNQE